MSSVNAKSGYLFVPCGTECSDLLFNRGFETKTVRYEYLTVE
jgi:hypothetical protein